MILLLDAHAVLWWLADDEALDPQARAAVANPANDVLVSAATVWEIAIKQALGKLDAPTDSFWPLSRQGSMSCQSRERMKNSRAGCPRITATHSTACWWRWRPVSAPCS